MNESRATDYCISVHDANELKGAVLLAHEFRRQLLLRYANEHGRDALVNLFSQFIGLANSVVENSREALELIAITEFKADPREAEQMNLPTIFGALQGVELAAGVNQRKTCNGCACRLGSVANQSPSTTCDLEWCIKGGEDRFMCHEDLDTEGRPTRPCVGFQKHVAKAK